MSSLEQRKEEKARNNGGVVGLVKFDEQTEKRLEGIERHAQKVKNDKDVNTK